MFRLVNGSVDPVQRYAVQCEGWGTQFMTVPTTGGGREKECVRQVPHAWSFLISQLEHKDTKMRVTRG